MSDAARDDQSRDRKGAGASVPVHTGSSEIRRVAIVGGGPGGALLAWLLARDGYEVDLIESRPDADKACGGGVTASTIDIVPELDDLGVPYAAITRLRATSPGGRESMTALDPPLRNYRRHDFDSALRQKAVDAGARLHIDRARTFARRDGRWFVNGDIEADFLVGAGGASCPVRRLVRGESESTESVLTTGWFIPGTFEPVVDIRFFPGVAGYAWWFPRPNDVSFGIVWGRGTISRDDARGLLRGYLHDRFRDVALGDAIPYAAPCPCLAAGTFWNRKYQAEGVALIGDSAGLCDPVTSEGIRHALHSAKLLHRAIAQGAPKRYYPLIAESILPELHSAAAWRRAFYRGWFLRAGFGMASRSPSARKIIADFALGGKSVGDAMADLGRGLPAMLLESARGSRIED
ncbi:NAD(P)/FAD-dependent oxidoreductase [bacterium]|nr:NAD(P)/FAD-dependent oxidoreductase [bacterium]